MVKSVALRIAPWILFLTGAVALYLGNQSLASERKTEGWVTTEGKVIGSSVETRTTEHGTQYVPLVLYEYRVGSVIQHGSRLMVSSQLTGSKADAQATVNAYPVGQAISVYYNPTLTSESVLVRNSPVPSYVLMGCGVLCVFLGPLAAVVLSRRAVKTITSR